MGKVKNNFKGVFFMGKNSLIKSTTKGKKSAAKKKAAKKTAAKAKAVAKAKAAPKKKAAVKAKAAPKPKAAVKAAPKATVAAKAAPAPAKKPVSVKDLLQKKFPVWKPEKLYSVVPDKGDVKDFSAPPFVSGSEEEQKRVKELLMKTFDMAEIKAVPLKKPLLKRPLPKRPPLKKPLNLKFQYLMNPLFATTPSRPIPWIRP